MEVLKHHNDIRLVKSSGKYSVQHLTGLLFWKKWKNISFGPYYPMRVGYSRFTNKEIAEDLYTECLPNGKFTDKYFHYKKGI